MRRAVIVFASAFVLVQAAVGAPGPSSTATIAAKPNPDVFGSVTTITGTVTGHHSSVTAVTLESEPFPYTGGFTVVATHTTDALGRYAFKVAPSVNTFYHVVAKTAPPVTSPGLFVRVRVRITLHVGTKKPAVGQRVRFRGFVLPAYNGKRVQIQRKTSRGWKTVAQPKLVAANPVGGVARSKFSKRVVIRRSGTYRVRFDPFDGARVVNTSPKRKLTVH
jgi:hypothetical protein